MDDKRLFTGKCMDQKIQGCAKQTTQKSKGVGKQLISKPKKTESESVTSSLEVSHQEQKAVMELDAIDAIANIDDFLDSDH